MLVCTLKLEILQFFPHHDVDSRCSVQKVRIKMEFDISLCFDP